jgi:hypothetical protein
MSEDSADVLTRLAGISPADVDDPCETGAAFGAVAPGQTLRRPYIDSVHLLGGAADGDMTSGPRAGVRAVELSGLRGGLRDPHVGRPRRPFRPWSGPARSCPAGRF